MRADRGKGKEIAEWFETFLKVVCWEYKLEPSEPYHDIAAWVVSYLDRERPDVEHSLPWRRIKDIKNEKG